MNRIVKNNSEVEIPVYDLGIILQPGEERDLMIDFDNNTICSSLELKNLLLSNTLVTLNGETGLGNISLLNLQTNPMMTGMELTWTQFKSFIGEKENSAIYFDLSTLYHVFAPNYPYYCFIKKNTTDCTDFETNYKTWCDSVKTTRADGRMRVHPTILREDLHPVFIGAGDGTTRDDCNEVLLFEMNTASRYSKTRSVSFNESSQVVGGHLLYADAPWGAYANVTIVHPYYGFQVRRFVKHLPLYKCNPGIPIMTDAPGEMPAGLQLQVKVTNPDSVCFTGSTPTGLSGKYFLIDNTHYVWFDVDNGSTDPDVTDKTGIEVNISTGDTDIQIAGKCQEVLYNHNNFEASLEEKYVIIFKKTGNSLDGLNSGDSGLSLTIPLRWKLYGWIKIHRTHTTVDEETYGF